MMRSMSSDALYVIVSFSKIPSTADSATAAARNSIITASGLTLVLGKQTTAFSLASYAFIGSSQPFTFL